MCGLSLSKIFGETSSPNIPSQSSEKPLYSSRNERALDEDDYSLPPVHVRHSNSIPPALTTSTIDIGRAPSQNKQGGLKRHTATTSTASYTSSTILPHAITSPQPIHSYAFTSSIQSGVSAREAQWIHGATNYVREYMRGFDSSHDFAHVQRVLAHAMHILSVETHSNPSVHLDPTTVALAALLHDVGDKKYIHKHANLTQQRPKRLAFADEEQTTSSSSEEGPGMNLQPSRSHRNHSRLHSSKSILHDPQLTALLALSHSDPETLVKRILLTLGAPQELARTVQRIVKNVSYSHERLDPAYVRGVMLRHPELAIVQDADRLDALGAIGIGRCFTYGGASSSSPFNEDKSRTGPRSSLAGSRNSESLTMSLSSPSAAGTASAGPARSLQDSVDHFEDKLLKLEGMMKTREGKRIAKLRSERLRVFRGWWDDEMGGVGMES